MKFDNLTVDFTCGICMPSNRPEKARESLLSTVDHLQEIAPYAEFLIIFQPPWTQETAPEFIKALREKGFRARGRLTEVWEQPIQIGKMRQACAELNPDCDVYMLMDDDFRFQDGSTTAPKKSSGQRFLECLQYLIQYPRCGVIVCKKFLGGSHQLQKIQPTFDDLYGTQVGMFFRNMKEYGFLVLPDRLLEARGAFEEFAVAYSRLERGFFAAKQMNNPTLNECGRIEEDPNDPLDMHNPSVTYGPEGMGTAIRRVWGPWKFAGSQTKVPRAIAQAAGHIPKKDDMRYVLDFK